MARSSTPRLSLSILASATLFAALLPPPVLPAPPDPTGLGAVTRGEAALTFSAGFIRQGLPLEGVISQITGDSQTTGNKMLLGEGDVTYLHLAKSSEAALGDLYT
ncbi:MAG: hypothetical protein FJ246_07975, partial [Nitrospira sp.]|nr:hypothetical protein [Nitrospira sp.]